MRSIEESQCSPAAAWAETLAYAREASPFYRDHLRQAGLGSRERISLEELHRIPPIDNRVVAQNAAQFLCVPRERIVDIVTTSGSTGQPLVWQLTEVDLQRLARNEELSFACAGFGPADTVLLAVAMDRCFMAGLAYALGLRKLGCAVVRVGAASPAMHFDMIRRVQPTAVVSVPSFLAHLAAKAPPGFDLAHAGVTKAVCIGEPVRQTDFSLNAAGRLIEEKWGAQVFSTYGVTEMAASLCECAAGAGGHLHPELLYLEVLDDAGKPVANGEVGELTATTFGVEAMPLIRYRTGDCAAIYRTPCQCGRASLRVGPIVGRKGQKLKLKGTSVFPSAFQTILEATPAAVLGFVIIARRESELADHVEVKVACAGDEAATLAALREQFQGATKVVPHVAVVAPAEIEHWQMPEGARKRRCFVDCGTDMPDEPNICVVMPVFNHALTVGRVARAAKEYFPVIIVDDGSTDATPEILRAESNAAVITLPKNQGKGAALRAGFRRAEEMGFSHAVTIDADGQHCTEEIPAFAEAIRRDPSAFIIGVRDLVKENAPRGRRITNDISSFWFKVETGVALPDTQCGFRAYPLAAINPIRVKSGRYAYELEVMVAAAWGGVRIVPLPISADYAAATSRMSHFHPWRDMAQISLLHSRLSTQSFCVPALLRRVAVTGELRHLTRRERWKTILRHVFSEHTDTHGKLALAVGLGFFCGIAPIWGFQIIAAAALAHKFHLNKAIAVTASHISFPLAAPFIMAGGLLLGHYLHTGTLLPLTPSALLHQIPTRFAEWFLGSIALGLIVGVLGGAATWVISRALFFKAPSTP